MKRLFLLWKYFIQFIYCKSVIKSDQYYDVIYQGVKDLGGIYVKLIQFICLRTDIFPKDQKIRFLGFYDAVPYENIDVNSILLKELGENKKKYLTDLTDLPIASGTFGQVYRGRLQNGTEIIVKAKRNNLLFILALDFFVLKCIARLFDLFFYQRVVNIPNLVKEFEDLTYRELDYVQEAKNANYFYKQYRHHPYIYIPQTYSWLSSQNILVQEYVGGVAITELITMKESEGSEMYNEWLIKNYQTDIHFVLKNLAYELFLQGITGEIFYADPHPGNIKILPNNRYALIDFGIVGKSPQNKRNYYNIINLIVKKAEGMDMKNLSREFLEWGANDFFNTIKTIDYYFSEDGNKLFNLVTDKYRLFLEKKREKFREIEINEQENFAKMYFEILEAGQDLKVRLPDGLLALLRTIAIYKSWNEFLEPNTHHMRKTYEQVLAEVDNNKLLNTDVTTDKKLSIEEAIEKIMDWLGGIAETDLPFYKKINQELKNIHYA